MSLGGFLALAGATLTFSATKTSNVWSGTVTISASSATLFPGASFTGAITPSQGSSNAITGTYTIGSTFSLTAQTLTLSIGNAVSISASGIKLQYDPNGAANQTLATIYTATATSAEFSSFPTATLSNLVINADGFSFGAFTLSFTGTAAEPTLSFPGNILTVSGVNLTVTGSPNFSVTYGASPSVSGTISLTLTGVQLFPQGNWVQFQASSVTGSYSFAGFDGTDPSGQLSLTVTGFQLSIGNAISITAAGNVTITPDEATIATVASATISSPDFPSLTATISNLQITQTGFALGTLALTANTEPTAFSDILSFTSLSFTLTNFAFNYSPTGSPTVSGTIGVTADNVVLFPGISFLDVPLGNLTGSYTFDAPGVLTFNNVNLTIPIGEAMTISLTNVSFTPDQTVMASGNATITSGLFPGLTAAVTDFQLMGPGFTLNAELKANNVSIGNFLSFASVDLVANNFEVNTAATAGTPVVSGAITATLAGMQLFPDDPSISLGGTVTASFALGSTTALGNLAITVTGFSLDIANELTLSAGTITITPDQTTLATIASATISSPSFPSAGQATATNLQITQTGFILGTLTWDASNQSSFTLGGILSVGSVSITLADFVYTYGSTPSISGSITGTLSNVSLFPGSSLVTSNFSNITSTYVFGTAPATFSVTIGSFSLTVANVLTLAATSSITITPDQSILVSNVSATLTVTPLNLTASISGLTISQTGFSIASASISLSTFALGGVVNLTSPTLTLTSVSYSDANGGSLSGILGFSTTYTAPTPSVSVDLGGGVSAQVDSATGAYNLGTGALNLTLSSLSASISGFVTLNASSAALSYLPATSTSPATFLIGVQGGNEGATAFLGGGSYGAQVTDASLALAVFYTPPTAPATTPTINYVFQASGSVSLVGIPSLTLSGNLVVQFNNTTMAVSETVNVDGNPADAIQLSVAANTESLSASWLEFWTLEVS